MSLDPEVRRGGNLPFGMVATCWMCDPRYSTNARTLYAILVSYADTQARNTAMGKPYRQELARQLGVSLSTLDRTLVEMEVAGLLTVEHRTDPDNPAHNDANVYHLHDAPLMWQGNGEWVDPLPAGVRAADVAKELIEKRRAEKRASGEVRRGGVPKGINTRALKGARKEAQQESPQVRDEEGGSSTHAATPGSTHAAGVAAPMLPNIQNPLQSPSPDPDAPSARSAHDARRASTGSRGERARGSAASGQARRPLTREERQAVRAVRALLPPDLNQALGGNLPRNISEDILAALAAEEPHERTPQQLVERRVMARWNGHWAELFYGGDLPGRPYGPLSAMLKWQPECGNPSCEDRVDIHTGEVCTSCEMRREDARASREAPETGLPEAGVPVPAPRSAPAGAAPRSTCAECRDPILVVGPAVADGLCRECRHSRRMEGVLT